MTIDFRLFKVNLSTGKLIKAVWLDPFSPLVDADREKLAQAQIEPQQVSTVGQLNLSLRKAHVLVIRLGDSADLLKEVLTLIAQLGCAVPVVCRVERRRMEVAVDAMRLGALHVLPSDEWDSACWRVAVDGLFSAEVKSKSYVFVDPISQHLLALSQRVAQTDVAALLVGPTGAGKEVLARVLHESSLRAKGPFVAMNCAALPEHLIEDMLFGHEKGAFTGAHKEHKGLFEQAQGGTVFLDEIGERIPRRPVFPYQYFPSAYSAAQRAPRRYFALGVAVADSPRQRCCAPVGECRSPAHVAAIRLAWQCA
jgi:two-component system response regulator FlrC